MLPAGAVTWALIMYTLGAATIALTRQGYMGFTARPPTIYRGA